jgi:ubiquinone/menaquinone biosynthesis C-methylase UbiE
MGLNAIVGSRMKFSFWPKYQWVSGVKADSKTLAQLEQRMADYYSRADTRNAYQALNDNPASHQPNTEAILVQSIINLQPRHVLEIGCGSGRLYQRLIDADYTGKYTGVEMSVEVITASQVRYPNQTWTVGSVYDVDLPSGGFDVVFSYFVLEHCVYPERALTNMIRWVKPGGHVFLVFPDFCKQGILPSQKLGIGKESVRDALTRGRLFAAVTGVIESRLRLPLALRWVNLRVGPWPINTAPRCLDASQHSLRPDEDAVYIASKREVQAWAEQSGLNVQYPAGVKDHFQGIALMQLTKAPITKS